MWCYVVKLASCKSALNSPVVYSTDRSKAVVPMLVLLFVALWFILRGDLVYVLPCVILFLYFPSFWRCGCLTWGGGVEVGGWSWCFSCICSICACLGLSVSSSSWCLGRAAVCDCGTPWTFLLPFFFVIFCFLSQAVLRERFISWVSSLIILKYQSSSCLSVQFQQNVDILDLYVTLRQYTSISVSSSKKGVLGQCSSRSVCIWVV